MNEPEHTDYDGRAGGRGSLRGIVETMGRGLPAVGALDTSLQQNKAGGFRCVSCAS